MTANLSGPDDSPVSAENGSVIRADDADRLRRGRRVVTEVDHGQLATGGCSVGAHGNIEDHVTRDRLARLETAAQPACFRQARVLVWPVLRIEVLGVDTAIGVPRGRNNQEGLSSLFFNVSVEITNFPLAVALIPLPLLSEF
jgi:hypothetical protein